MNTPSPLSPTEAARLIEAALDVRTRAYAPYSHYRVGAALLADDGVLYTGCNVENATYGATICAERTAVVKAVSAGALAFRAIVVATQEGGSPCGICRQVLHEFSPDMWVIMVDTHGHVAHECALTDLLPAAWGPQNLNDHA